MDDEDEVPARRGGRRRGWALAAVVGVVALVAVAVVTAQRDGAGDFAVHVADTITKGGDEAFRSLFCESAVERGSGVDVFVLARPIKVTVDTVNEDAAHARAVLVVDKLKDRVFIAMEKQPGWCVSEIYSCTTAARPTIDPPRLTCDGLMGRD